MIRSLRARPRSALVSITAPIALFAGLASAQGNHQVEHGLEVLWETRRDTSVSTSVRPRNLATAAGRTFALHGRPSKPGFWVRAVDSTTGAELWTTAFAPSDDEVREEAALAALPDGSEVWALSTVHPTDGSESFAEVVRIDGATGAATVVDVLSRSGEFVTAGLLGISPDGTRAVVAGAVEDFVDRRVLSAGYDVATGARLWTRELNGPSDRDDPQALDVGNDGAFLYASFESGVAGASDDGLLVDLNVNTGLRVWSVLLPASPFAAVVLPEAENVLFVSTGGAAPQRVAYDPPTGNVLWSSAAGSEPIAATPDGSTLFRAYAPAFGVAAVEALDGATGASQWDVTLSSVDGQFPFFLDCSEDGQRLAVSGQAQAPIGGPGFPTADVFATVLDTSNGQVVASGPDSGFFVFVPPTSIAFTDDGARLVLSRWEAAPSGGFIDHDDPLVSAYDSATGAQVWEDTWDPQGSASDRANDVILDPAGETVFATGLSGGYLDVAAYDAATGGLLWSARESFETANGGENLAVSADGATLFVQGRLAREIATGAANDLFVAAYDAGDGSKAWEFFHDDLTWSVIGVDGSAIDLAPDGSALYVTYTERTSIGNQMDLRTFALDTSNGSVLWDVFVGLPALRDRGMALVATADIVYVTGSRGIQGAMDEDPTTIAFDAATGAELWMSIFTSPDLRYGIDIALAAGTGTLYIAGNSGVPTDIDAKSQVIAYDAATGSELWTSTVEDVRLARVEVASDGSVIAVGTTAPSGSPAYQRLSTRALDPATGAELWSAVLSSPTGGVAFDLALGADGNTVLVTGQRDATLTGSSAGFSPPAPASDFVTVAYDVATGEELWVGEYDSPDELGDRAAAIAVDGQRAVVAGLSGDKISESDFALVSYRIPSLVAGVEDVGLSAGGTQSMNVRPGASHAGGFYWIFGSATGAPSQPLGSLALPLVPDAYFFLTARHPFAPPFGAFLGVLDGDGLASASLTIPAGADPGLAGITLHHAYLAAQVLGVPTLASNAISLELGP